jgi:arylsulfatase A-like enzyme
MAAVMPRLSRTVVLLLCFGLFLACGGAPAPQAPPNVVLIVIDTLRTDGIGCYGAGRNTSPHIDALASEGIRFARAYSTAPWTKPAVASILTGLYPSAHGADDLRVPLPWKVSTLAEILGENGYATAAVVSHTLIGSRHQYQQGFDKYLQPKVLRTRELSTDHVTTSALRFVRQLAERDGPFFLFVHYFDPHYPYMPRPEVGYAGAGVGRLQGGEPVKDLVEMLPSMTPEELAFVRALYDEEIHFTDAGVGRLLDGLSEAGLADETLVVLTADHGEEFGERGWIGHTRTLYEELVRVPMILRLPGGDHAGRVVETPVSVVDVAPTVLDLAGIGAPESAFHGRSLLPALGAEPAEPAGAAVLVEVDYEPPRADAKFPRLHRRALVLGRHKLIRDELSGRVELYDVISDPHERDDRAAAQPEVVRALQDEMDRQLELLDAGSGAGERLELSPEQLEHLRALGYVGDEPAASD